MNAIKVVNSTFKNTEVRAFEKEGLSWFVAKDISDALGYRDASALVRMLDDDETGTHLMSIRSENGVEQQREVNVINENGMYHALIKSRKPEAKPFRKWVTSEVLPSIRKTGTYTLPSTITPAQQRSIQEAVAQLSKEDGAYGKHYGNLKTHFRVGSYKDLPEDKFQDAMEYLLGEWVPEETKLAIPEGKMLVDTVNFKAMLNRLELLNERYDAINDINAKMYALRMESEALHLQLLEFATITSSPVREARMLARTLN